MHRGHRHRIAQTQIVKLVEFRRRGTGGVALVDAQHHGLAALLQHGGHRLVVGGDTGTQIGHQDNHVSLVDGQLSLGTHLRQDHVVGLGLDTAGIRQHKLAAAPLALRKDAVAGDTGGVLHDGQTLSDQFIKQSGFSHVGTPHHGDNRLSHWLPLLHQ